MIEKSQTFRIKIIFLLAIITLLTFSVLSYIRINILIDESKLINHTNLVRFSLTKTFAVVSEKESNQRGYLLTNDTVFLLPYFSANNIINSELNAIDALTKDNASQQQNLIELRTAIEEKIATLEHNMDMFQKQKISIPDRLKGKVLMDNVRTQINKMQLEEDKLLSSRSAALNKSAIVTPFFTIVLIIGSLIIIIASYNKIIQELKISYSLKSNMEQQTNELFEANKELAFQNDEKEKRSAELVVANKELAFQNEEKEKRAAELVTANKELAFQNEEKEKRAAELVTAKYARSLIEASLDPLVTISVAGKILDVNDASVKVTGVPREKLIDTDFSNYFTEPIKAQEGYLKVFEKGFVADYPLTIKNKNGNLTDVLYNASVYKDDKGNVLGVFAAARDITEHKKVENVLKESEEKFKLIFEKSIAPIVVADDKGNYLEVNKAAEEIFEYSINELMGMNVGDLITTSNPNAAAQYEEYIKKGEEKGEFGFTSKKGAPKIVQYQAVRIKPDFNLSILMDVTEQKTAQRYARSLIEASLDPLVTISVDGKILDVNEASVKVTGFPREKLIDTDFSNYFTEPTKAQEGYRKVFEKGFVADYPLTIKHKNGNLTDVLYNASVYKDDNGKVLGVFAAARDVTEQKWAKDLRIANKELAFQNEEKEKRAAELVIANKELESFNYISSHDLQEPLRKIQTFASRLMADETQNLSTKGKDYVLRMEDAAKRMQSLISDLLAYSRTTNSERKFETTDLNAIIESVKKDLADTISEKNATIEVFEMCHAQIIPFQFRQLMENIISNALKFAKPGLPPHLVIISKIIKGSEDDNQNLLPEKEYCRITITDNGIGFEPKYKDHIFELFKRLHDKEKITGTGIGLTIVKKIVENHNGLITAISELNEGATFTIYIPNK